MIKRIGLLLFSLITLGWAGEVEDVLKSMPAPAQEYVRVPAKFVVQRLEKTARRSGDPVLSGFTIDVRKPGAADMRVDVNLENMTMLGALKMVADETGTILSFEGSQAVLTDAGSANTTAASPKQVVVNDGNSQDDEDGEVSFEDINSALVFVETNAGRGSAFVTKMNDKWYIISNQHNFMGATKLELRAMHGELLKFKSFEFCRKRDLVRFELEEGQEKDLVALKLQTTSPGIGDKILVYGNSAGGNVATELKGRILGVGPRDIEVDAAIVSGNSGSPIMDEHGRVLGVATYISFELNFENDDLRKQIFKGTRFSKPRRYGVRIPMDGWVQADMRTFLNQTYQLADTKNYIELLHILAQHWSGNEDYKEAAYLIMTSFASRGNRVKPPYEFHSDKAEEEVRMFVKAFKRNYEEFVDIVQEMDLSRNEAAKLGKAQNRKSSTRLDRVDYHLRSMMLGKARQIQDEMKKHKWMSEYLKECATPLDKLTGDLIRRLEAQENMADRIKAVM